MIAPCLPMEMNSLLAALGGEKGRAGGDDGENGNKTVNASRHVRRCSSGRWSR